MAGQSKRHALLESVATTVLGMINAVVVTQMITDLPITTNIILTCILTCTSILLKYVLRRVFNRLTVSKERIK